MIEKIQNIENVGRLVKTGGSPPQYSLAKNTHIYAGNTHGKSTMTAIVRSLCENNPDFIKGRKTFGTTLQQRVNLTISGNNYRFDGSAWLATLDTIRIFDTKYIHDNFFSPDETISDDGQKRIETFILGSEGVRLAKDVVDLTATQKENVATLSATTRLYNSSKELDDPSFEDFLKIDEVEAVDGFIDEQNRQLNSYKNQESIRTQLSGMIDALKEPDYDGYRTKLAGKLEIDVTHVTNHIHNSMKANVSEPEAKEFLRKGMQVARDDSHCPYCAQDLNTTKSQELVKTYNDYFSGSYNSLANDLRSCKDFFIKWSAVSLLRKGVIDLTNLDVAIDLRGADTRIEQAVEKFQQELTKKDDFAYEIDFTQLGVIQQEAVTLITALETLRAKYEGDLTEKVNDSKKLLRSYELAKKRYDEPWKKNSDDYIALKDENENVVAPNLAAAFQAQSDYANSVYGDCMQSVNECLEALGVTFRVKNLHHRGRTRNDLFSLEFDEEHAVGIAANSNVSDYISRHTLSESDRRALCLAFFIASIMNDAKCKDLIVLLDDPVSSFDADRRSNTVQYLRKMREESTTPDQMIILTHDKEFYYTLAREIKQNAKTLMLEWKPASGTSDLSIIDVDTHKMFMSGFYRRMAELRGYLNLPDSELNVGHLQNVRHLFENIMKRKYYEILKSDIDRLRSIDTFLTTLSGSGMPYDGNTTLVGEIRSLLPHTVHHDQDNPGGYDTSVIGAADIRRIITKSFEVLHVL